MSHLSTSDYIYEKNGTQNDKSQVKSRGLKNNNGCCKRLILESYRVSDIFDNDFIKVFPDCKPGLKCWTTFASKDFFSKCTIKDFRAKCPDDVNLKDTMIRIQITFNHRRMI